MIRIPRHPLKSLLLITALLLMAIPLISTGCSDDECVCPEPAEPPRVPTHYPADGDTLIKPDPFLTVTFNIEMDPATISAGSFTLYGPRGPVGASVNFDSATATLTPFDILFGNSIYTARVSAGVSSTGGAAMGVDYAWSFTTGNSRLILYPDIEYTLRDSDGDSQPDSIYGGGPPGRFLFVGEIQPLIEDRPVLEFSLDQIVHDEVLEAAIFFTVYDVNDENYDFHMEAWGFSGNGTAEMTDWSSGHLIVAREMTEMHNETTYAFEMTATINNALATGANHAGFRLMANGYTHARIYTLDESDSKAARILLIQ